MSDQKPIGMMLGAAGKSALASSGITVEDAWIPNDMQRRAMTRSESEVAVLGGKYGGKTEMGRMWMVSGNWDQPDFDAEGKSLPVNQSYTNHPNFLGAVIRLNEKDLAEWVDRAIPYYCDLLGGEYTKSPSEFRWQTGARIFLGHAQDSNAWTKYQGQNIVRFLIEEAGQMPDVEVFDQIRSCCRSLYPEMRAQIMLTANPGGRGQQWIFDRYIEPKDRDGHPVMHPTAKDGKGDPRPILEFDKGLITIEERVKNPFGGPDISNTRVWIPSYLSDNPHALNNTAYIANLATMQDEKMRRAYLLGDWKALRGTYFDIFSRDTHTYDPRQRPLASWWRATASLDWGFVHESAAYWHKLDPETKQNLIYKEFVTNRTDPVELGAELARGSMEELRTQGSLTFHVSHDLYQDRIGDFTWIELIAKGAQRIIGEGNCYIPEIVVARLHEQCRIDGKEWDDELGKRILSKEISGITFRRAPKARAVGFMYLRSLMRLEPLIKAPQTAPDFDMALRICQEGSANDYLSYLKSFDREVEILPQLLISQACPRLIEAIPKAIHSTEDPNDIDKGHFLGHDSLDSLRYLMAGIRDAGPSKMPQHLEREHLLMQAHKRMPHLTTADMIWISRGIEERQAQEAQSEDGFTFTRASRAGRRGRLQ